MSLRPVNRSLQLAKVQQRIFSQPWAMHPTYAMAAIQALSSKYAMSLVETGDAALEGMNLDALAHDARIRGEIAMERRQGQPFDQYDDVAIIPVEGILVKDWGIDPWCGITGYDGIKAKVIAACQDDNIKGIWFDVDSGGGDVSGLFDLCDVITSLNQRAGGKPMFGFANEHAYSAAYAILSCCDKLYCPRFGGVGSVGVITTHVTRKRQNDMQGIDVTVIRSGTDKALANGVELLPERAQQHIQAQVDVIRDGFVDLVAGNMPPLSKKTVRETEGLDYMGDDARAIGFVSDVCSWDEAWGKLQTRINR